MCTPDVLWGQLVVGYLVIVALTLLALVAVLLRRRHRLTRPGASSRPEGPKARVWVL